MSPSPLSSAIRKETERAVGAPARETHYSVLGLVDGAEAAEIRRAFRRLALRHHPDRAGEGSTELFQRIALAYEVLSDPIARSAYDARLEGRRRAVATGDPAELADVISRLAGPLETLIARAAARRCADGVVELLLNRAEAARGGTAAIGVPVRVPCPTCGGCAQVGTIWCTLCEDVTACIAIPPAVTEGATFTVRVDPHEATPPLRVRVRLP